jgi:hypothetical protein
MRETSRETPAPLAGVGVSYDLAGPSRFEKGDHMTRIWKTAATAFSGLVLFTMSAVSASAGCGDQPAQKGAPRQSKIDFKPASFVLISNDADAIVGMWNVTFTSAGKTVDFGYSQWHSDGTEIMNSGGHTPASGNFCLGVWTKTGNLTYQVNHYALAYVPSPDPPFGTLVATINIREYVTLDHSGNTFSGTFTIDVTPASGPAPPQMAGTITGQRITAN